VKKLFIFITLLLFLTRSFGQQPATTTASKTNTDYLQKSKNQKKTAWIMLGGGATLIVVAILIPPGEFIQPDDPIVLLTEQKNDGVIAAFFVAGTLSMLGSIPFFIASGKNKRRAASLSFNNMMSPQIKNSSMVNKPIPAVSLKINL